MRDAVWNFAEHAAGFRLEDAPPEALKAAKTYILDSLRYVQHLMAANQHQEKLTFNHDKK